MTEYPMAKTGEYPYDTLQFIKLHLLQKNIWQIINTSASISCKK